MTTINREKIGRMEIVLATITGIAAAIDMSTAFSIVEGVRNYPELYNLMVRVQQISGAIAYSTGALWGYLQMRK